MNSPQRPLFLAFFSIMALTLACIQASPAQAQNWSKFQDEDNIFHVLIPENYKINKKMLRISDDHLLITTELNSSVDQRPYKDIVKQYVVKYDQTLMNAIPQEDIPGLVQKEMERYIKFYTKQEGVLRNREFGTFNGMPGGELFISYRDKEKGVQSIRVRFMYSDVSRIEQIIMGPEDSMTAHTTKDYFSSMRVNNGRTKFTGDLEKEWSTLVSPFALFTQLAPKRAEPYMKAAPEIVSNDRIERVSMKFYDPVYDNELFYNVYGYRLNTLMTMEHVQKVIMDRHLKKFNVDIGSLKFSQTSMGDYPVLATKVHFKAPEKYPYMNTITIRAHYYGNFVVVQELAGNNAHVESLLAQNLTRYFRFYPLRGHKKLTDEKAGIHTPVAAEQPQDAASTSKTPSSQTEPAAATEDEGEFPVPAEIEASTPAENTQAAPATSEAPPNIAGSVPPTSNDNADPVVADPASLAQDSAAPEAEPSISGQTSASTEPDVVLEPRKDIIPLVPDGAIDATAGQ